MKKLLLLCFVAILISCTKKEDITTLSLNQNWEFRQADTNEWLQAIVPGTVHQDLLRNMAIPNFRDGFNEDSIQWVETKDWEYKTNFQVSPEVVQKSNVLLQFKGLDTHADIYLNDKKIASTHNMFVQTEVDVKQYLKAGSNELRIYFHSPVNVGMELQAQEPYLLQVQNEHKPEGQRTRIFSRKAPFHYGWDWGPRVVTSGIWRPINLLAYNDIRLSNVHAQTARIEGSDADVNFSVEVQSSKEEEAKVKISIGNTSVSKNVQLKLGLNTIELSTTLKNAKLWWSNGLGDANMYVIETTLTGNNFEQTFITNTGIRTVELVQEPDSIGRSFYIKLNGVPVFSKGANYIPSEILTTEQTEETYMQVIQNALDANMNMLRVWGGAIYEEDLFYDLCDKHGILLWQDFMFACEMNPFNDAHLDNIRQEAEYNVQRLQNHPSVVLWCGNNENLLFYEQHGWKKEYNTIQQKEIEAGYAKLFYEILPAAVQKYDSELSYWPSSPQSYGNILPDRKSGDEHDWFVWFASAEFKEYENEVPRFCSEYGLQAYPSMSVLKTFAADEDLNNDSKMMRHRQKSPMKWIESDWDGNDHIKKYSEMYYGKAHSFDDFVYYSQLTQALGLREGIEIHRRNMPRCMGSLYWQINDCWAGPTWSSVDYYGNWKAAHYYVKKAFEKSILSLRKNDSLKQVLFVSDDQTEFNTMANIKVIDFTGKALFAKDINIINKPMSGQVVLESLPANIDAKKVAVIMTMGDDYQNIQFLTRPKNLDLPKVKITTALKTVKGKLYLNLTANGFAHGVYITYKGEEIRLSDNFIDLLPGETKRLNILSNIVVDIADIEVRCYNNTK